MMTIIKKLKILLPLFMILFAVSCSEQEFGANPFDPNTPKTVSQMPKINSFFPAEGKPGDTITVEGINFTSATTVTFGGRNADSFEILSDTILKAVVSTYGASGTVSVTNHKGTMFLNGFIYIKPDIVENSNLALNKPASASSELTSASLGIDGDRVSRWSADENDTQWYQVDLQKTTNINNVKIYWEGAYCDDYIIQISQDNVTFQNVYTTTSGNGGLDSITFPDVLARYVKIVMNKKATPWNISFYEFEVYNIPPPANLALGMPASASTEFTPASLGVDGDSTTRWSADDQDAQWFMVDLQRAQSISKVRIKWEGAYCGNYSIQTSTDNVNYVSVFSTTTGDGGNDDITFAATEARYVKVVMNQKATPWNISFWELEIYK